MHYINCSTCTFGFRSRYSLENHIRNVHKLPKSPAPLSTRIAQVDRKYMMKLYVGYLDGAHQKVKKLIHNRKNNNTASEKHQPYCFLCKSCKICIAGFVNTESLRFHLELHEKFPHRVCKSCQTKPQASKKDGTVEILSHETSAVQSTNKANVRTDKRRKSHVHHKVNNLCNENTSITYTKKCMRSTNSRLGRQETPKKTLMEKNHVCTYCQKAFTDSSGLKCHIRVHTGEKNYFCSICEKSFRQSSLLKRHLLRHSDNKKYVCDICSHAFFEAGDLRNHKLVHSGVRRFICQVCKYSFARPATLRTHMLTHSSEKNHVCNLCNRAFTHSSSLKRHMSRHSKVGAHENVETLSHNRKSKNAGSGKPQPHCFMCKSCKICIAGFENTESLGSHLELREKFSHKECKLCQKKPMPLRNLKPSAVVGKTMSEKYGPQKEMNPPSNGEKKKNTAVQGHALFCVNGGQITCIIKKFQSVKNT